MDKMKVEGCLQNENSDEAIGYDDRRYTDFYGNDGNFHVLQIYRHYYESHRICHGTSQHEQSTDY